MIWSVAPVSAPLKAWNGEPGSRLISTGAPVIAACFAGLVYITKRLSAGAGKTIDWEMMVRMGNSPRLQNLETPVSARCPRPASRTRSRNRCLSSAELQVRIHSPPADRVMRSLGLEPRPPYPKGFEVEQGDWSLLDPVRARPKLYRDAG